MTGISATRSIISRCGRAHAGRAPRVRAMGLLAFFVLLPFVAGCFGGRDAGPVPKELLDCRRLSAGAQSAAERGDDRTAQRLLDRAVKSCPSDAETRRRHAEILWRLGRTEEAAAEFNEALILSGPNAEVLVRRGSLRCTLGRLKSALGDAETALDIDPKFADAWLLRARVHRRAGRADDALADYCRVLAADGRHRAALSESAELCWQIARTRPAARGPHAQRALASLQTLLESYPAGQEPQEVLALVGETYFALGRFWDASESFELAAERAVAGPDLLRRLAEAQLLAGRPAEALFSLDRALAMAPDTSQSYALRERIHVALKNRPAFR